MDNIEDLFDDSIANTDYSEILDKLGLDIEGLEKEMGVYQPKMTIKFSKETEDTSEPVYAYETDSGFDLHSTEQIVLGEFGRELVPTGLHIDIPDGYEIQVRSKSGLAIKQGLMVLNSPGTVDQGYTGEIKVIIFNTNPHPITIDKGQKIAQAVLSPVVCGKWVKFVKVKNIEDKDRSDKGFGSTGI
jgi:dUTP pyrophosphatase